MEARNWENLLSIKTDPGLDFKDRLDGIIKNSCRKKSAYSYNAPNMNIDKQILLMDSHFHHNLAFVIWYGCAIVVVLTTKRIVCMKNIYLVSGVTWILFEDFWNWDRCFSMLVQTTHRLLQ